MTLTSEHNKTTSLNEFSFSADEENYKDEM